MQAQGDKGSAVAFLKRQVSAVHAKIQRLQEYEDALTKSLELLAQPHQSALLEEATATGYDPKWKAWHAQRATLEFLTENPGHTFKASEIAHALRDRRVRGHDGKSFASVVAGAVRRLVTRGDAEQRDDGDGVAIFRIKEGAGSGTL